jgi:flagellar biosynthesis chaperone FliJ
MRQAVGQIVDVKQRREDTAQDGVRRCRLLLEEAARRLDRAREELQRYAQWRPAEENRLWDGIMGTLIKIDGIDELKAEIGLLRGKEMLLGERVEEAERARATAHKAVVEAQAAYDAAVKARQKFEELADILDKEWREELERREESELEELAGTKVLDIEERLG